jgi:hypothetical protein
VNRIYEKLKNNEFFKDKLEFDEVKNRLTITFNEYARLDYLEGGYKAANDEGVILFNDSLNHWHITDDEEAVEIISGFANGDVIYIEDTRFFTFTKLRAVEKEAFEKKKEKYMAKRYLRIYTGNAIIKRSGN